MTTAKHILIEAHRGDSASAPENTLAAFRRAVELGVPSVELDVHPARDGTLVVIHDDTVDRTTDGTGAVSDKTLDELRCLDAGSWFGSQFAGERIPTLAEVLELLAPSATGLNIEIKASRDTGVAETLVRLLRRFDREREYVVSSFDLSALLQVRAIAPAVTLALIGHGPEILPLARQYGLPWIHSFHKTLDARVIEETHANGMHVNVWTVDDPAQMAYWQELGVDKLCTNQPAVMLAALADWSSPRRAGAGGA